MMMAGVVRCAALAVALFLLAACSQSVDDAASSSATDTSVQIAGPAVRVLDFGAEPRQLLRYELGPGTESVQTESRQVFQPLLDGQVLAAAAPVSAIAELTVTRTTSEGRVGVITEVISAGPGEGTDPALNEVLETRFAGLVGTTTQVVVDNRGFVEAATLDDRSAQAITDLLGDVIDRSNPFPDEAVGVGARWRVETEGDEGGIPTTTRTTSTVREFTPGGVIIDLEIDQVVEAIGEEIDLGGAKAIVERWDVSGTGTVEVAFGQFTPLTTEIRLEGSQLTSFGTSADLEQLFTEEISIRAN